MRVSGTDLRRCAAALLLAGGCASGGTTADRDAPRATATAAGDLVRHVAPFPVLDAAGRPYSQPFLGGFDVPRPQFIDIDGDGDRDLFVQERSDELMFFENTGSVAEPRYEWRTDRYADLSIGEWNRFVDLDGDGDMDLLAEQPFSYIRYYRNDGSASEASFVLAADSLHDVDGEPIFSDRQNIPSITDIDCDGRLDLFLGRVDGTITLYTRSLGGDVPRFEFVTDRFQGIEIIGQVVGGPPSMRHGANAMAFGDFDGDEDLDFFWGDYFEPGVLYIANTGGCSPSLRDTPRPVPVAMESPVATSGYNMPVPVDFDEDGDLDLFLGVLGGAFNPNRTAADNFWYLEHTDAGLDVRTRRFIDGIDIGSESIPAFADIDGDGDLDLLVGNKIDPSRLSAPQSARLYVFRNTGSATAPAFQLADTLDLATAFHYAPAPGDLDGDGDLDMLLGTWNDGVLYLRNEGTPQSPEWVQDTTATVRLPRGGNATPALIDIDADGDLDLFVGEASGEVNFFRNVGSAQAPAFELVTESFLELDAGRRSIPAFADIDADGDMDLFIGAEDGTVRLWRNTGTATEFSFEEDPAAALDLHSMASPAFADLDGDGVLELIAGGLGGGLVYYAGG